MFTRFATPETETHPFTVMIRGLSECDCWLFAFIRRDAVVAERSKSTSWSKKQGNTMIDLRFTRRGIDLAATFARHSAPISLRLRVVNSNSKGVQAPTEHQPTDIRLSGVSSRH